jgi:hypothetical protein
MKLSLGWGRGELIDRFVKEVPEKLIDGDILSFGGAGYVPDRHFGILSRSSYSSDTMDLLRRSCRKVLCSLLRSR